MKKKTCNQRQDLYFAKSGSESTYNNQSQVLALNKMKRFEKLFSPLANFKTFDEGPPFPPRQVLKS